MPNAHITPSAPPPAYVPSSSFDFSSVPTELVSDVRSGNQELVQQGMQGHEARVCLILDVSGSMQNPNEFFSHPEKGNQIQNLINKALALAFLFDDNATIELFPFGEQAFEPPIILNKHNFKNATQLIMDRIKEFRPSTNYADPVRAIRRYYHNDQGERHQPQKSTKPPVFALFVTDGEPNAEITETENQFIYASHQAIFFKFIALKGKQKDMKFTYLKALDDHGVKDKKQAHDNLNNLFYIDNCDLQILYNPNDLTMKKLIHEYRPWLAEAWKKGLLLHDPKVKEMDVKDEGRTVGKTTFPASYKVITENISGDLLKAKKMLTDYTKDNSMLSRFFHGHWNRHHVDEVHQIVMTIGAGEGRVNRVADLLVALRKIPLTNKDGSLARRIQFISENFDNSTEMERVNHTSMQTIS